ncbi:hypothetical protein AAVH_08385 [Aphelenchoides avenae]|nr:hypothetical protein AAVH_08385 [Aphelenchus avenae]
MADNGAEPRNARQNELVYEAHAAQLRQRISQLITVFAGIEAEAGDLHPTINDDDNQLDTLEDHIHNNINDLQPLRARYEDTVAEWDQLDRDYGILTTDTPWTRSMHAARKKCLNALSNRPPLPSKIEQLTNTLVNIAATIGPFRQAHAAQAAADAAAHAALAQVEQLASPTCTVQFTPHRPSGTQLHAKLWLRLILKSNTTDLQSVDPIRTYAYDRQYSKEF